MSDRFFTTEDIEKATHLPWWRASLLWFKPLKVYRCQDDEGEITVVRYKKLFGTIYIVSLHHEKKYEVDLGGQF